MISESYWSKMTRKSWRHCTLMPDGIETVAAVRCEHPSVKIAAMSGGGRHVGKGPLSCPRLLGGHATPKVLFDLRVLRDMTHALLEPEPNTARCRGGNSS